MAVSIVHGAGRGGLPGRHPSEHDAPARLTPQHPIAYKKLILAGFLWRCSGRERTSLSPCGEAVGSSGSCSETTHIACRTYRMDSATRQPARTYRVGSGFRRASVQHHVDGVDPAGQATWITVVQGSCIVRIALPLVWSGAARRGDHQAPSLLSPMRSRNQTTRAAHVSDLEKELAFSGDKIRKHRRRFLSNVALSNLPEQIEAVQAGRGPRGSPVKA
jgi:hypothetical protein